MFALCRSQSPSILSSTPPPFCPDATRERGEKAEKNWQSQTRKKNCENGCPAILNMLPTSFYSLLFVFCAGDGSGSSWGKSGAVRRKRNMFRKDWNHSMKCCHQRRRKTHFRCFHIWYKTHSAHTQHTAHTYTQGQADVHIQRDPSCHRLFTFRRVSTNYIHFTVSYVRIQLRDSIIFPADRQSTIRHGIITSSVDCESIFPVSFQIRVVFSVHCSFDTMRTEFKMFMNT